MSLMIVPGLVIIMEDPLNVEKSCVIHAGIITIKKAIINLSLFLLFMVIAYLVMIYLLTGRVQWKL